MYICVIYPNFVPPVGFLVFQHFGLTIFKSNLISNAQETHNSYEKCEQCPNVHGIRLIFTHVCEIDCTCLYMCLLCKSSKIRLGPKKLWVPVVALLCEEIVEVSPPVILPILDFAI